MSITIWILIFQNIFGLDWHGDHQHDYSITHYLTVEESVKTVHDFYLDLTAFGESHPLIREANCISTGNYCYQYQIIERPFLWIPYNIEYKAEIENPAYLGEIIYHITEIPRLKPTLTFQFEKQSDSQTRITINVQVEGNPLLRKFLAKKIMKAQYAVIENKFGQQK